MVTTHPTDYGPEPSVASLQAEIFRLEGEIERLRRADPAMRDFIKDTPISEPNDGWAKEVGEQLDSPRSAREHYLIRATIEGCAKVARNELEECQRCGDCEDDITIGQTGAASRILAGIEALKDKPAAEARLPTAQDVKGIMRDDWLHAATIEGCAKVAEDKAKEIEAWSYQSTASRVASEMLQKAAAAIRALKDKP